MRKYWHVLGIGLQNNLTYRVNYFARAVFGLIPLIAILYIWRTIFAGKGGTDAQIADFSLVQMVSYYLLVTVVDALTGVSEDDWQIAADIKDGNISQFLLKPMDYLWYRFWLFVAGRAGYIGVAIIPLGLFIATLHHYVVWPADWGTLALFCLSVLMTAMLQFFLSYGTVMLAFWVLEVSTFIFAIYALEYLASGHLFPLGILPPALARALMFTPFPYQLYFPVSIYLGKTTGTELWFGLAMQAMWLGIAYAFARFMWSRGIKHYGAAGG